MGEDLSTAGRTAVTLFLFAAVLSLIFSVFRLTKRYDRQWQSDVSSALNASASSDVMVLDGLTRQLTGAAAYATVSKCRADLDTIRVYDNGIVCASFNDLNYLTKYPSKMYYAYTYKSSTPATNASGHVSSSDENYPFRNLVDTHFVVLSTVDVATLKAKGVAL